jgi:hypothetical protein
MQQYFQRVNQNRSSGDFVELTGLFFSVVVYSGVVNRKRCSIYQRYVLLIKMDGLGLTFEENQ